MSTTLTTVSTLTNGIYMPSLPKQQSHKRDHPAVFAGNNKLDTTARSSNTFTNWASRRPQPDGDVNKRQRSTNTDTRRFNDRGKF
eukprot:5446266-Amphidinium_carterae.1